MHKESSGFSQATLEQALRNLSNGKTLDQYNLPASVKRSIAATHYSSQQIADACATLTKPKPVLSL